jgi:hypothetical protein
MMYKVALGTTFLPVLQFSHLTKYSTIVTVVCDSCPTTRHEGAWGERRFSSYSFSTSALDWGEWSASRPEERTPGTHCTGGWVGPRAGLDTENRGKILSPLPGIEPRSPGRPAHSQLLYWLSYPGSLSMTVCPKLCPCKTQPTHLYSDWTGLSPNHGHHLIKPAAPELRHAAIFTLELVFVELVEVRNETWE